MTSFRFIHASFPDPALSKREIRARLARHRRALLAARKGWERPLDEDGKPDPQKWLDLSDDIRLSLAEQRKIDSRAERISDRHAASTGLQHLRSDDMKKLEVLRHCVRLARVDSEHQADELAAS
ncbi:MAG: AAA family ATPase, partial [Paracoccaceae bacterium]